MIEVHNGSFRIPKITSPVEGQLIFPQHLEESSDSILHFNNIPENVGYSIEEYCKTGNVIHGILDNNLDVTLIIHIPNIQVINSVYFINMILKSVCLGEHLTIDSNMKVNLNFKEVIVNFTTLHNWIGYFLVQENLTINNLPMIIQIDEEIDLEIFYSPPLSENDTRVNNQDVLYMKLRVKPEKSIEYLLDYIYNLEKFFNFFYHDDVFIHSLYGVPAKSRNPVRIVFNTNYPKKLRKVSPSAFKFDELNTFKKDPDTKIGSLFYTIHKWFELNKKDNPKSQIFDFFFAVMYDHGSYEEGLFLTLCGFLEAYYEYNFKSNDFENRQRRVAIYTSIKTQMIKNITDELFTSKLMSYLSNFREPSFQEKIKEIIEITVDVVPYWSSMIMYFDEKSITKGIKQYTSDAIAQNALISIIMKSKNVHHSSSCYVKMLKVNCLRKELHSNPDIQEEISKFMQHIYRKELPREIVNYRNNFAHGNFNIQKSESEERFAKKISHLVGILQLISQICILVEVGYVNEKIIQLYNLESERLNKTNLMLLVDL